MARTGLLIGALLLALSHENCTAKASHQCPASSCGNILNIYHPFRLNTDPPKCGDPKYNLFCENNVTVLHLNSAKFYLQEINYYCLMIRALDPSVCQGNCSSLPLYSLGIDNVTRYSDPYHSYSGEVLFLNCPTAFELEKSCRIELMVLCSSRRMINNNITYPDVHHQLSYGFELWWSPDLSIWIGVLHGVASAFGIPSFIIFLVYKWQRRHLSMYDCIEEFLQSDKPVRYSYSDINKMTNGFKDKLGEGSFGRVYKAKLKSGSLAAVKLLGKSKVTSQDFFSEVATIGRIHHVNVVKFIAFCPEGANRALVYDFMPNGSLAKYIFPREESTTLGWERLYKISLGVAVGLIVYTKAGICKSYTLTSNLTTFFWTITSSQKISDFGLAKSYPTKDSIVSLTTARGTLGYMALSWSIETLEVSHTGLMSIALECC